jgi:hypothetical protein
MPIVSHRDTLRLLVYISYLCDQVLKVLYLSSGGSLALFSAHFSCELLSTNSPSTLTLTAEAEVLKLHESCYQLCSYLKPVSSKVRRGSPPSIEDLSNISPPSACRYVSHNTLTPHGGVLACRIISLPMPASQNQV